MFGLLTRLVLASTLVAAVAGCTNKVPPPLTAEQRVAYGLERIAIVVPEDSSIWWGDGDDAARAKLTRGADLESAEGQQALRSATRERLVQVLEPQLRGILIGENPPSLRWWSIRFTSPLRRNGS